MHTTVHRDGKGRSAAPLLSSPSSATCGSPSHRTRREGHNAIPPPSERDRSSLYTTLALILIVLVSGSLLYTMSGASDPRYDRTSIHAPASSEGGTLAEGADATLDRTNVGVALSRISSPLDMGVLLIDPSEVPVEQLLPARLASYTVPADVIPLSELTSFNVRAMIVAFASLHTFAELDAWWPPLEMHYLLPQMSPSSMGTRLNITLFIEQYPQDTRPLMKAWLKKFNFTFVEGRVDRNYGDMVYRSPRGVLLHVAPLAVRLPSYINEDISLTARSDWMRCGRNKTFSFEYVMYNTVFTYHIMRHPLLAGYEYYQVRVLRRRQGERGRGGERGRCECTLYQAC
jgi:hypothetical protein